MIRCFRIWPNDDDILRRGFAHWLSETQLAIDSSDVATILHKPKQDIFKWFLKAKLPTVSQEVRFLISAEYPSGIPNIWEPSSVPANDLDDDDDSDDDYIYESRDDDYYEDELEESEEEDEEEEEEEEDDDGDDNDEREQEEKQADSSSSLTQQPQDPHGLYMFKLEVFDHCNGRCVISGVSHTAALDVAHIWPSAGNDPSNGILLRLDLHRLFTLYYFSLQPGDTPGSFIVRTKLVDYPGLTYGTEIHLPHVNVELMSAHYEKYTQLWNTLAQ